MSIIEFITLCSEELRPDFQKLERQRLRCLPDYKSFVVTVAGVGVVLTIMEFYFGIFDFLHFSRLMMPGLALFVILVGLPVLYLQQFRRFQSVKDSYRTSMFPRLLKEALPQWTWQQAGTPFRPTALFNGKCKVTMSYEGTGSFGNVSFQSLELQQDQSLKGGLLIVAEHNWPLEQAFTLTANYDSASDGSTSVPSDVFNTYFTSSRPTEAAQLPEMIKLALLNFSMDMEMKHYGPVSWEFNKNRVAFLVTFYDEAFEPTLQESILDQSFYCRIFDRLNIIEAFRRSLLLEEPSLASFVDK